MDGNDLQRRANESGETQYTRRDDGSIVIVKPAPTVETHDGLSGLIKSRKNKRQAGKTKWTNFSRFR